MASGVTNSFNNAGFEYGTFSYWNRIGSIQSWCEPQIETTSHLVFAGQYSARIGNYPSFNACFPYTGIEQNVPNIHTSYVTQIGVWYKFNMIQGNTVDLRIGIVYTDGTSDTQDIIVSSTTWKYGSFNLNYLDSNKYVDKIQFMVPTHGASGSTQGQKTVWIDNTVFSWEISCSPWC